MILLVGPSLVLQVLLCLHSLLAFGGIGGLETLLSLLMRPSIYSSQNWRSRSLPITLRFSILQQTCTVLEPPDGFHGIPQEKTALSLILTRVALVPQVLHVRVVSFEIQMEIGFGALQAIWVCRITCLLNWWQWTRVFFLLGNKAADVFYAIQIRCSLSISFKVRSNSFTLMQPWSRTSRTVLLAIGPCRLFTRLRKAT